MRIPNLRKPRKSVLTQSGLAALQQELHSLTGSRKAAVDELTWARDMGDRSENAAYKSARRKLSGIDNRIRFLKKTIDNSIVVKNVNSGNIDIGSIVTLSCDGREITYHIVGDHETDPPNGKISYRSPIGVAIIGKKVGDTLGVKIPRGSQSYKIVKID